MPDWGYPRSGNLMTGGGAVTSTSRGTSVTSGAANTKGTWTEIATPTHPCEGFWMELSLDAAGMSAIDVGIGGATTSVDATIFPNFLYQGTPSLAHQIFVPLKLAANTRVCVRHQNKSASAVLQVNLRFLASNWSMPHGYDRCDFYGTLIASTGGLVVDPGATVNTKGSWVDVVAGGKGLGIPASGIILEATLGNNSAPSTAHWLVDVGVDGQVIIPNLLLRSSATQGLFGPQFMGPIAVNLAFGADLQIRAQCSINNATDRLLEFGLHLFA